MAHDLILNLNEDNFDEHVTRQDHPILVDFWATWCGPCKDLAPTLDAVAQEMVGRVRVAKVDVEENGTLVNRLGIRSIPTLVVFKDGKVVDRMVGNAPKDQICRMLAKHAGGQKAG